MKTILSMRGIRADDPLQLQAAWKKSPPRAAGKGIWLQVNAGFY